MMKSSPQFSGERGRRAIPHSLGTEVLAVLLALVAVFTASGASATTHTVTSTADSGTGTLRDAIAASVAGDTVNFAVAGPIVLTSGELNIGRSLTITGPPSGITVERSSTAGTPNFRIIEITAGTVSLSNLTISNGAEVGSAGMDATVDDQQGTVGGSVLGGGILNAGSLTLTNCSVSGNAAAGGVGGRSLGPNGVPGGDALGGGIFNFAGSALTLVNCTVSGNSATGGTGGANAGSTGGPGGIGFGGGIYWNAGSTLRATNCRFSGNRAVGGVGGQSGAFGGAGGSAAGGGLYSLDGLALLDCTVDNNSVSGGAAAGGSVQGGAGGAADGGGILEAGSGLALTECTLAANTAAGGMGGTPMGVTGGAGGAGGAGQGGNLENSGGGATTFTSCTIAGGAAVGGVGGNGFGGSGGGAGGSASGGGFGPTSGPVRFLNTIVAGNDVIPGQGGTSTGLGAASSGAAAGPDVDGTVTSQGHNLIGKTDGSMSWTTTDLTGTVKSHLDPMLGSLALYGGATPTLRLLSGSAAIDAGDDSVLSSPTSLTTDQRGFPRKLGAHVDIGAFEYDPPQTGSTLVVNTLADHAADGPGTYDCTLREAIDAVNANTGFTTITFKPGLTGTITLTQGRLLLQQSVTINGPGARILTVNGNETTQILFVDNSQNQSLTATINGLTFADGIASGAANDGGAILNSGTLTVNNCMFTGNQAVSSGSGSGFGGALCNTGKATLTVNNCTFSGNSSQGVGGAILNLGSTLNLNLCTFTGNSAVNGGALFSETFISAATATIKGCTFSGNSASPSSNSSTGNGGGIWINNPTTVEDTIIAGNTTAGTGPDVQGAATSGGYNFIGQSDGTNGFTNGMNGDQVGTTASHIDPKLDTMLKNNGGPTDTLALLSSSTCLDKGKSFGLTTDQRGLPRPADIPSIANASGGDGSDIGAFEVQPTPAAPTGLKAVPGAGEISLAWNPVTGATGYNAKRATAAGGPFTVIGSNVSTTSFNDVRATPGVTFFYVVSAVNSSGESSNSSPPVSAALLAVDVTVGIDNRARLLRSGAGGAMSLWSMDNSGTPTPGTVSGPFAGYTLVAAADGSDGITRVLWNRSDGVTAFWLMNAANALQSYTYLPASGGFAAVDVAVGSDKQARILWKRSDGAASVTTVSNSFVSSSAVTFGPYAGYTPKAIASGGDGFSWLLWNKSDGSTALWLLNPNNTMKSYFTITPISGWKVIDVTVGSDNRARLLWVRAVDGAVIVWTVDETFHYTYGGIAAAPAGAMARAIAAGADGISRIVWSEPDGGGVLSLMNSTNYLIGSFPLGVF